MCRDILYKPGTGPPGKADPVVQTSNFDLK